MTYSIIAGAKASGGAVAPILESIVALASNGLIIRTSSTTVVTRTLTGTANRIGITNGDGVAGNPTFDIGSDVVTLTGTQTLSNKTFSNALVLSGAPGIIRPAVNSVTALQIANAAASPFVTFDTTNQYVGVGTVPSAKLHVVASGVIGLLFQVSGAVGVFGQSDTSFGIQGSSTSSSALRGISNSSRGVYGSSTSGSGVLGDSSTGFGVEGVSVNNNSGRFTRNTASPSSAVPVLYVLQDNVSDPNVAAIIRTDGNGDILRLSQTADATVRFSVSALGVATIDYRDSSANAVNNALVVGYNTSGTPTAGIGTGIRLNAQTSTTVNTQIARLTAELTNVTHASRTTRVRHYASDSVAEREYFSGGANGSTSLAGWHGTAPIAKPTITGSRGGNAALASLLTELANYGLITDGTSA